MQGESSERLPPRAVYELLGEANLASATTLARASALAEEHRDRTGQRRLIGVAMNLDPQMLSLKGGRTRQHAFFDDVLFGIRMRADAGNVDLLLLTAPSSQISGEASHYFEICRYHEAEGIVLAAFLPDEPELAELVASGFPTVAIETQLFGPRASFISSDNVGGAAAAVRHLAELGRKRIAYIGAWGPEPANIDRRLGYESALGEFELELREEYVMLAGWLHGPARDLTRQVLELPEPPDAIFCASDVMAIGAMAAIEEAGMRIPEDIAVAGFDDSDYASIVVPSLTSVRQNLVGLGTAAVEAILRMLDSPDNPPPTSVLPVELVVRESTVAQAPSSASAPSQAAHEQTERIEILSGQVIGERASRLSASALFRLLDETGDSLPRTPGTAFSGTLQQEWRPDKRRLVALALDTSPDQSFRHAFFDELFYGIRARAYARAVDLLVITNVGTITGALYPPFLELCERYRADGLVIISLPLEEPSVAALAASSFPCVTFDVDLLSNRIAFVMSDNIGGAVEVTHHLIEAGRRRIAFIGGRGDERPTVDRRFGYQSELARCGLPCPEEYVAMANWLPRPAFEATQAFLALPEPPDAVFCASDVMAIGAMAAIEAAGLKIPDDVAVVGFDDIDYARLVEPSLTTVRQNQDALAERLIAAMLGLLEHPGEPPAVSVVPVELVVRESSTVE
ncbi:MAG: substrate-binding domain-containing protein [Gaiellaceae bacterium]